MSVDGKGRTSVPARFREVLESTLPAKDARELVMVPWGEGCIRVFTAADWRRRREVFDADFAVTDIFGLDEDESDIRRTIYGLAAEVSLDGQGRALLSRDLREWAGIDGDAYWVGIGPVLEIWDPDTFNARITANIAEKFKRARERRARAASTASDTGSAGTSVPPGAPHE